MNKPSSDSSESTWLRLDHCNMSFVGSDVAECLVVPRCCAERGQLVKDLRNCHDKEPEWAEELPLQLSIAEVKAWLAFARRESAAGTGQDTEALLNALKVRLLTHARSALGQVSMLGT